MPGNDLEVAGDLRMNPHNERLEDAGGPHIFGQLLQFILIHAENRLFRVFMQLEERNIKHLELGCPS